MRILVVTSQFPVAGEPTRGRPILQTVRELAKLAEVRVVSPVARYPRWAQPRSYLARSGMSQIAVEGVQVDYVDYRALPLLTRPFNGWLCARAITAAAQRFVPDVVLSYWLYPDAWGAMRVARALGVPLVAGARGSDIRVRDPISRALTRSVVNSAQRLLVVSEDLGRLAASDYGAEPTRVCAIPNGCDARLFQRRDRAAARRQLGIDAEAELIVYVGRLVPEKGLRELVSAMRTLAVSHPRARAVLLGDGPMRAELEATLQREPTLPLSLGGAQVPEQVAIWLAAADLLTLPSWSEGHPNVLVEAQACGRAVVACAVGGVPEAVDAQSAILIPARDAPALTEALHRALTRVWDEQAISQRYSRDWSDVAAETLANCQAAQDGYARTTMQAAE